MADDITQPSAEKPGLVDRKLASERAFDSFVEETRDELTPKEESTEENEQTSTDTVDTPEDEVEEVTSEEDSSEDEDVTTGEDEDTDTDTDEDEPDTEDTDTTTESQLSSATSVDEVLEILSDKTKLEAALRLANVDDISDLPIIKDLLGRERQSAADRVKNDMLREQLEERQIQQVLDTGRKSIDELIEAMDKVAADAAAYDPDDPDKPLNLQIPSKDYVLKKANEFANASVTAYHNSQFLPLSETIYSLPELQFLTEQQQQELQAASGKPPADWLATHLNVMRDNLWNMAINNQLQAAEQKVNDIKTLLQDTHAKEIEKITAKHEKELAKAVERTRKETRTKVMAEFANNGAPPRLPQTEKAAPVLSDEDEIEGTDIEDIFYSVKKAMSKADAVV